MVTRGAASRSWAQSRAVLQAYRTLQCSLVSTAVTRLGQQSASNHIPAEGVTLLQPADSQPLQPAIADQLLPYTLHKRLQNGDLSLVMRTILIQFFDAYLLTIQSIRNSAYVLIFANICSNIIE